MSSLKRTRIPTRVGFKEEKLIIDPEKENVVEKAKTTNYEKKSTRSSSISSRANVNLEVPSQRNRILSDNAILPSTKKVKFVTSRPKVDGTLSTFRPPLADLKENVTKNVVAPTTTKVQKELRVTKTLTSKRTQKVKEITESTRKKKKYGYETKSTYQAKYSCVTDYKTVSTTDLTPSGSKPSTTGITTKQLVTEEQFYVDREKITIRKSLTPHPNKASLSTTESELDTDEEEIFVDASNHFITYSPQSLNAIKKKAIVISPLNSAKLMSPIKPNIYTSKTAVICQGIPETVKQPLKKMSLLHKMQLAGTRHINADAYCLDIYNSEYLEDAVLYQMRNDWKCVIKKNILKFHNPCEHTRAAVINWLIKAQDYLDQSTAVLFTTVRLFDSVLGTAPVPGNMCQLIGFVIMWIISKFEDTTNTLTGSKMVALCNNAYSVGQFLKMEKKLLAFFGFDLYIPDVTFYTTFYIKNLDSDNVLLLRHSVHYILECYALNMDFSTVIPSVQAAAAVCLALNVFNPHTTAWEKLKNVVGYYGKEELEDVMQNMLEQIQKVQDPNYKYRQPYQKYATSKKVQASIVLLRKLVAT